MKYLLVKTVTWTKYFVSVYVLKGHLVKKVLLPGYLYFRITGSSTVYDFFFQGPYLSEYLFLYLDIFHTSHFLLNFSLFAPPSLNSHK